MFDPIFERLILLLAGDTLAQNIFSLATMGRSDADSGHEGVVIGAVANRRKEGDRIEVWVGGAVKGTKVTREWLNRLKLVLAKELELPMVSFVDSSCAERRGFGADLPCPQLLDLMHFRPHAY